MSGWLFSKIGPHVWSQWGRTLPPVICSYTPEYFLEVASEAMQVMRDEVAERFLAANHTVRVKNDDKTLISQCDERSGALGRAYFTARIANVCFSIEDDTHAAQGPSNASDKSDTTLILLDPVDGTRAWVNGLDTSTIIAASYDRNQKQVECCVIAETGGTGRLWRSRNGMSEILVPQTAQIEPCRVWRGELNQQTTVFIDAANGFKAKSPHCALTQNEVSALMLKIFEQAQISMAGSNGLHQALTASGGNFGRERVVGGITTAIGGPWDIAGAHLVIEAGGAARGFSLQVDGKLLEQNPLNPFTIDLLVYGNSVQTVDTLADMVAKATRRELCK